MSEATKMLYVTQQAQREWKRRTDMLRAAGAAYREAVERLGEHVTYECEHVAAGGRCEHR